jgi:hypothetical protein
MAPLISYRQKVEAVTAACIQANPDILKRSAANSSDVADVAGLIRLMDAKWMLMRDFSDRRCEANIQELSFWWNLQNDALSSQSDECIGFLYDILRCLN